MTYNEVEKGQRVRIDVRRKPENGTVHAKEIVTINGKALERIYINTERGGRRLCSPSVLELID